jgi:DNA-binding MarR family transcriptional regulator
MADKNHQSTPKNSPLPESPFRELIRIFGLLERQMNPYFARFGISGAQWGVLRSLHRAEQEGFAGLRLTDLSERLLVRPPSVTGVVDRLERTGLVQRDSLSTDLRAKQVSLTPQGRVIVERVLEVHPTQMAHVLSGLSAKEQGELGRLLYKLRLHLTGLDGEAPCGTAKPSSPRPASAFPQTATVSDQD